MVAFATGSFSTNSFSLDSFLFGEVEQVTDWWPLVGGFIDRKKYDKAEIVEPILEKIAHEVEKPTAKYIKDELRKYDLAYDKSFKSAVLAIKKAQDQAREDDDEESLLLML